MRTKEEWERLADEAEELGFISAGQLGDPPRFKSTVEAYRIAARLADTEALAEAVDITLMGPNAIDRERARAVQSYALGEP